MYLTYDNLPKDIQTELVHYHLENPDLEAFEILKGWYQFDRDGNLCIALDTVH